MKAADLREKSVEDLVELEKSLASDFFKTRLKNFTNQLDDTSAIRKTKRDRARVLTVLQQRRAAEAATAAPSTTTTAAVQAPTVHATEVVKEAPAEEKPKKAASKKTPKKGEAK